MAFGAKEKILNYYQNHEKNIDIAFFLGGVLVDLLTLSDIDNIYAIIQQAVYLAIIAGILFYDVKSQLNQNALPNNGEKIIVKEGIIERIWPYRFLVIHFLLGSLLSIYSIFYVISSSFFTSAIFIFILVALMFINEFKWIKGEKFNIRFLLFVICLLSFFLMLTPIIFGYVGLVPFLLSLTIVTLLIFWKTSTLRKMGLSSKLVFRDWALPGHGTIILFLIFYFLGWIPPVPLAANNMGIYHNITKNENTYHLFHEKPFWKFWETGDQTFLAVPGDKIYFFAQIFSPGSFSDVVNLHWYFKDLKRGWVSTDLIPMKILGGRKGGYRGFSTKQNYQEGKWRISLETLDKREIGRIYFNVKKSDLNVITPEEPRKFSEVLL